MKFLRIPEVAQLLDVTVPRAYELARTGHLPVVRLGRQLRVDPARLEAWLAGGGTSPESTSIRPGLEVVVSKAEDGGSVVAGPRR